MEREQDRVVVEGGAILERNTRGTFVLTARRLSPKRVYFSCKYKTEQNNNSICN